MAEEKVDHCEELLPWFELKTSQFAKMGYENIAVSDLRACFQNYLWKHAEPQHYYQKVFDIMKLTVNQYFDYESLEAQVYRVASLEEINFDDFLK